MIDTTALYAADRLATGAALNGRYTVTGILRDDGGSTLYLGRIIHVKSEPVMIKEVAPAGFIAGEDRSNARRRFEQEVQVLSGLKHPALPLVLDAFSEGGRHYMVMSYHPGETLETMLERRGRPFAEEDVVGWALEVLSALGPMHRHAPPVIFRNLKPASLVVDPSGTLHLRDFGLARFYKAGRSHDTAPVGAAGYAPPEQLNGATDVRSDIFSLGATMHRLLTNQEPSLYPPGMLPPATCNPAVSSDLAAIIARATDLDPARRWANGADMEAALRRHALGLTATARPRPVDLPSVEARPGEEPPRARLVIAGVRLSSGRQEALQHLMRLTWLRLDELEMALLHPPAVVPLAEPSKASLRVLKGLGVEVRPVWPMRGLHPLDATMEQTLQQQGCVEVPDLTACEDGVCLCRYCHFGWVLDHGATPPRHCPSCDCDRWNTIMLLRCYWCGHEHEERADNSACPCCGLS